LIILSNSKLVLNPEWFSYNALVKKEKEKEKKLFGV